MARSEAGRSRNDVVTFILTWRCRSTSRRSAPTLPSLDSRPLSKLTMSCSPSCPVLSHFLCRCLENSIQSSSRPRQRLASRRSALLDLLLADVGHLQAAETRNASRLHRNVVQYLQELPQKPKVTSTPSPLPPPSHRLTPQPDHCPPRLLLSKNPSQPTNSKSSPSRPHASSKRHAASLLYTPYLSPSDLRFPSHLAHPPLYLSVAQRRKLHQHRSPQSQTRHQWLRKRLQQGKTSLALWGARA